jgi:hypothetical protein
LTSPLLAEPRAPFLSQQGPWVPRDLGRALFSTSLGAIGLIVGWYGVSGQVRLRDEVVWLVVSTCGVGFAGMAMTTWLTTGMRAIRSEHRALHERLITDLEQESTGADDGPAGAVTTDGMRFYHRPSCVFVVGKAVWATDGVGLSPCTWCTP